MNKSLIITAIVSTIITAIVSTFALGVVGCDEYSAHDVKWYKGHDTERIAERERCNNNPGDLRNAPSCINAFKAAKEVSRENFKLTPLPRYNKDLLGNNTGKAGK